MAAEVHQKIITAAAAATAGFNSTRTLHDCTSTITLDFSIA
jgi:hypothetical protein